MSVVGSVHEAIPDSCLSSGSRDTLTEYEKVPLKSS